MAEEKINNKEEKKPRAPRRTTNKKVQDKTTKTTNTNKTASTARTRSTNRAEKTEKTTRTPRTTRIPRKTRENKEKENLEKQESKELVVRGESAIVERKSTRRNNIFKKPKLKIIPLGGLHEVGKNITVFEYDDEIIVVDCGLSFPDDDMLGVDLVIPDIT